MRYYPAFLDLQGKPCVVVGGGGIAWRKVKALRACGARVTVVSPEVVRPLARLVERRRVRWIRRRFKACDLQKAVLAVSATDEPAVNQAVSGAARRRGCPVNVVDQPALCSFIVPSVMSRGALMIAISTGGASPALSKWLRRDLTARYGARFARVLERMRVWRRRVHGQTRNPRWRKQALETLLQQELRRAGAKAR